MPKEWIILHQSTVGTGRSGYRVLSRKMGIFGAGRPRDAGTFDTKEEAEAFVAQHCRLDDSVTHGEGQEADARR
jgi:hypothetical protein